MPKLLLTLLLLLTCIGADAQTPVPVWAKKLKLSGLSGSNEQRLAIINNETFSQGEVKYVKVAGHTVQVTCITIGQDSVLIQVEDLPGPYVLNLAGELLSMAPLAPVQPAVSSPRPPASPPVIVPPAKLLRSAVEAANPSFNIFHWLPIILAAGLFGLRYVAKYFGKTASDAAFENENSGDAPGASVNPGEALVAETISQQFDHPHLLLNNLTLPTQDGTTQIDHVLVADTGIFVIETKHYSGWIFGKAGDAQWTQTFHNKKFRRQNPLRQNYLHVKTLESLLDLPETNFYSVVVFTGEAEFKTDLGPNVLQLSGLISFLTASRPLVFGESDMANIVGRIEMKRERRSLETDEYHINHVRQKIAGKVSKAIAKHMRFRLSEL